jgi:hypothetical protein
LLSNAVSRWNSPKSIVKSSLLFCPLYFHVLRIRLCLSSKNSSVPPSNVYTAGNVLNILVNFTIELYCTVHSIEDGDPFLDGQSSYLVDSIFSDNSAAEMYQWIDIYITSKIAQEINLFIFNIIYDDKVPSTTTSSTF